MVVAVYVDASSSVSIGLDEATPLATKKPSADTVASWTGFILIVVGVARMSTTAAFIVAGVLLFAAGAMAGRDRQP